MRTNRLEITILIASAFLFFAHDAPAFYNAQTGCWPNRDPLNTLTDGTARFDLFKGVGLDDPSAASMANQINEMSDYIFVNNSAVAGWDFLGLTCITLRVSGTFTPVNEVWHKIPGMHNLGNHLTFTACCPAGRAQNPRLSSLVPIASPSSEPFPSGWTQFAPPTISGPCSTFIFQVPWRATVNGNLGWSSTQNPNAVLNRITLVYDCCCRCCMMPIP